jgi:predicted transcriptional regulator
MKKRINLELNQPEESAAVFKALSSPVRLLMLQCLLDKSGGFNISELAEKFKLPLSTAALHVRILEEAGLIFIQEKPGLRGAQKICAILAEDVYLNIFNRKEEKQTRNIGSSMPLGNYFDCLVTKPCGMAGKRSYIGIEDSTQAFYSAGRTHAQIIWFSSGFLEYRFPNHFVAHEELAELSFSFEACSEAPGYNHDWPSDITVWINNREVFTFRSSGDFGDKRGIYNPDWWPDSSTQYGELHHLEITKEGCFGDGRKSSDLGLEALEVTEGEFISFKIGVKEDAEYMGGINLFGEQFGNYKQNIYMTVKLER